MIKITAHQIALLAPHAKPNYKRAFLSADSVLAKYGINDKPLRVAHFMAQVLHETGGLHVLKESLNYKSTDRLEQVWPSRFKTDAAAAPFVRNPDALANKVYNGRMGNREGTEDGATYVGRGLLQLTGREDYERYGKQLNIDLVGHPDLAEDARYALQIAAAEWTAKHCNVSADKDDIRTVTHKINGGHVGLPDRRKWLVKTKHLWH